MRKFYIPTRKIRVWRRKHQYLIKWFLLGFVVGVILTRIFLVPKIKPVSKTAPQVQKQEVVVPMTPQDAPQRPISGKASYYSVGGCLGCRADRLMANGQRLDDTRATVAYNHLPLNTKVKITNSANGKTIVVPVTDRGGFERHGKIADLSLATKNILQCNDVCNISISKI